MSGDRHEEERLPRRAARRSGLRDPAREKALRARRRVWLFVSRSLCGLPLDARTP